MQKSKKIKIISAVLIIIAVVGLFWFMFSGDNAAIVRSLINDDLTSEEYIELLRSFGIRGSLTLSILSMLQVVLTFLPAEPVQVLAGIGYGLWHGALICLVGVIVGNTIVYVMYKVFGDKLADYFHRNIDVDFHKIRSSKRFALIIFLLYFLPAIPYGLICFFSASIDLKYPRYILITSLGSIPSILIGVGMGHLAMATSWIISLIVFVILIALIVVLGIKRKAVFAALNRFIHKQQKTDRFEVREANGFVYAVCKVGVKVFAKKVKYKGKNKVDVQTPCIVLCSHGSFIDFVYSGLLLRHRKPHFVVARLYSYNKWLKKLLHIMGAIPKSMFSSDMENVKNCMKVLSSGGVLTMMPEARLSTAGEFEDIQDTTVKFVKKMKVPVYGIRINGSYFANPKWGDKIRKGSTIECEFSKIADAKELETLTESELLTRIENAIKYDDFEWIKNKPELTYKSKTLAEGLENILYKCPVCGSEFTIETKGREVTCSSCGLKTALDDRYGFVDAKPFENFKEWYDGQRESLRAEILSNPDYQLKSNVTLKLSSKNGKGFVKEAGNGVCVLNRSGLTYTGTIDGETVVKEFPISLMYRILFGAGVNFEIYDNKEIYFFVPEEKKSCVKWYIASAILKDLSQTETE